NKYKTDMFNLYRTKFYPKHDLAWEPNTSFSRFSALAHMTGYLNSTIVSKAAMIEQHHTQDCSQSSPVYTTP
ncbi:hypothetical protein, partial [cf. Phormidesmis sp. LEGE 11477]|uniref:hypothetical protein n=1 Tax=cf. Phormidesmis sp. LEGE 11477 TaxID=1828680 RepID=UPI001D159DF8